MKTKTQVNLIGLVQLVQKGYMKNLSYEMKVLRLLNYLLLALSVLFKANTHVNIRDN